VEEVEVAAAKVLLEELFSHLAVEEVAEVAFVLAEEEAEP
jgi:hypothetical protein